MEVDCGWNLWLSKLTGPNPSLDTPHAQNHAQGHVESWSRARNRTEGFPSLPWALSSPAGLPSAALDNSEDHPWPGKGPSGAEQPELKICLHLLSTS